MDAKVLVLLGIAVAVVILSLGVDTSDAQYVRLFRL
jgi:hypothetical protein